MTLVAAGSAVLSAPAAAAYLRALAAGAPDSVTSSYRDPGEQMRLYNGWVARLPGYNFALHPSKSDHCKGLAIDLAGVKAKAWFRVHGRPFGWLFTDGSEDWHIAYREQYDQHAGPVPAPAQEDDMPYTPEQLAAIIKAAAHDAVVDVLRAQEFELTKAQRAQQLSAQVGSVPAKTAAAVLDTKLDGGVGTVRAAVRDGRIISRRHEAAWREREGLPDDPNARG